MTFQHFSILQYPTSGFLLPLLLHLSCCISLQNKEAHQPTSYFSTSLFPVFSVVTFCHRSVLCAFSVRLTELTAGMLVSLMWMSLKMRWRRMFGLTESSTFVIREVSLFLSTFCLQSIKHTANVQVRDTFLTSLLHQQPL